MENTGKALILFSLQFHMYNKIIFYNIILFNKKRDDVYNQQCYLLKKNLIHYYKC